MTDKTTTLAELKEKVALFMGEREWGQFHSPKNMSMAIATEAAELMEIFRWLTEAQSWDALKTNKKEIEHEIADVAMAIIEFCNQANIDLTTALIEKLDLAAKKYPIEKAKGNCAKYTDL